MAVEQTLSIIKPDAVSKNHIGEICARFEKAGLKIVALKLLQLSRAQAEGFYAEHKGRPFFESLVDFMVSGPVVVQVLAGENAVALNRDLMGATDPQKQQRAQFVQILLRRLTPPQYTARIRRRLQHVKLLIFSTPTRLLSAFDQITFRIF